MTMVTRFLSVLGSLEPTTMPSRDLAHDIIDVIVWEIEIHRGRHSINMPCHVWPSF